MDPAVLIFIFIFSVTEIMIWLRPGRAESKLRGFIDGYIFEQFNMDIYFF